MRQFMGEQTPTRRSAGRILVGTHNDVATDREGARIHGSRRLRRRRIAVHANFSEVMTEARLHGGAVCGIERRAGGIQDVVDNGRYRLIPRMIRTAFTVMLVLLLELTCATL
jgi:hypothetical protein